MSFKPPPDAPRIPGEEYFSKFTDVSFLEQYADYCRKANWDLCAKAAEKVISRLKREKEDEHRKIVEQSGNATAQAIDEIRADISNIKNKGPGWQATWGFWIAIGSGLIGTLALIRDALDWKWPALDAQPPAVMAPVLQSTESNPAKLPASGYTSAESPPTTKDEPAPEGEPPDSAKDLPKL